MRNHEKPHSSLKKIAVHARRFGDPVRSIANFGCQFITNARMILRAGLDLIFRF